MKIEIVGTNIATPAATPAATSQVLNGAFGSLNGVPAFGSLNGVPRGYVFFPFFFVHSKP